MMAIQRREIIKSQIEKRGEVLVAELSREFQVSETTIRRDLDYLASLQIVSKTYGGAVLHDRYALKAEPLFTERTQIHDEKKKRIAKMAAGLIEDGDVIILDNGTTTSLIPLYIQEKKEITVITNSLHIAYSLIESENVDVIVLGGELRKRTGAIIGNNALLELQSLFVNKVFLSCSGVSLEGGVTVSNINTMALRKQMMESSHTTTLLVDSSKIGKRYFAKICPLTKLTNMVTDMDFQEKDQFEDLGVRVLISDEGEGSGHEYF